MLPLKIGLEAKSLSGLRVAIVTDSLTVYAGAERVLVELLNMFPQAQVFALVNFMSEHGSSFLGDRPVKTTFVQRLPFAAKHFRNYLELWPLAIEQLDLQGFDLILSSQYAVAHGVITSPTQTHLVYTHSPMRYAWDLQAQYLSETRLVSGIKSMYVRRVLHNLRMWDFAAAQRVDHFAANSSFVAQRISKFYRREAHVIHPPVDTESFGQLGMSPRGKSFVTASRLVPYKRVDLIVEAFNRMPDKRLIVIGDGPELQRLKQMARSNVSVIGHIGHVQLRELVASAAAFVFAAVEDFGISPVEAQAAGTPVIGLGKGGLLETVRGLDASEPTGVFFSEQTADSIVGAVREFDCERDSIQPDFCRKNALRFDTPTFRAKFLAFVELGLSATALPTQPVQLGTILPASRSAWGVQQALAK